MNADQRSKPSLSAHLCLLALLLLPLCGLAQDWESLDPEVRALLQPIRTSWSSLPSRDAERLAANARAWLAADADQQQALRRRHADWMDQPPQLRAAARQRLLAWQALSDAQREALKASAHGFSQLSETEQAQARARFGALGPEVQLTYLLPSEQRAAAALAQRLFPFVEAGERDASLAMLTELGKEGRAHLEQRARRMNPQQREALRARLLEMPQEQRLQHLTGN